MMFNIRQAGRLQLIGLAMMCSGISASAIASASVGHSLISAIRTKPALQACAVLSVCATIDEMRLGPIVFFDVDVADAHALVPFGWEFDSSIGSLECTSQSTALVVWGSLPCRHARTDGSPKLGGTVIADNTLVPYGWEFESNIGSLECTSQATSLVVWGSLPCMHARTEKSAKLERNVIAANDVALEQSVLQLPPPIKVPTSRALVAASYFAHQQRDSLVGPAQVDRSSKTHNAVQKQLPPPIKVPTSRALVAASFFAHPQRQQEPVVSQDRLSNARWLLHLMINAPKSLKLVLSASPARERFMIIAFGVKLVLPASPAGERFLIIAFFRPEYEWCVAQEAGASDAQTTPCTTTELLAVTKRLWPAMLVYGSVWFITQALWAFLFPFCLDKLCALALWCSGIPRLIGRYILTRERTNARKLAKVLHTPNVKAALAHTVEEEEEAQARTMVVHTVVLVHQPRLSHSQCQVLTVVRSRHIVVTANNAGRRSNEFDIDKMIERLDAALARRSQLVYWSAPPAISD
jgi:hypothetical protein